MEIMPEILERTMNEYFSNEPVDEKDLEAILQAATMAPSAYHEQTWRFFVAKTSEEKEMLMEYMMPGSALWAKQVPVLILIGGNIYGTHDRTFHYWNGFDCGAAWAYLSLEAQHRGYATNMIYAFDRNDLKREFEIEDEFNYDLFGIIALGKAAKDKTDFAEKPLIKSVEEVSFRRKPRK